MKYEDNIGPLIIYIYVYIPINVDILKIDTLKFVQEIRSDVTFIDITLLMDKLRS